MRLIDADALYIEIMDRGIDGLQLDDLSEIQQVIADAPTVFQWRKLKDEKPTYQGYYICGNNAEGTFFADWDGDKFDVELSVTHWMPLPPHP